MEILIGDLVKINKKLIQRPINIYLYEDEYGYFSTDFFELKSTAIVIGFKNEKKMTYTKLITDTQIVGWVRTIYLERINQ